MCRVLVLLPSLLEHFCWHSSSLEGAVQGFCLGLALMSSSVLVQALVLVQVSVLVLALVLVQASVLVLALVLVLASALVLALVLALAVVSVLDLEGATMTAPQGPHFSEMTTTTTMPVAIPGAARPITIQVVLSREPGAFLHFG
jgi:hypothetical protein